MTRGRRPRRAKTAHSDFSSAGFFSSNSLPLRLVIVRQACSHCRSSRYGASKPSRRRQSPQPLDRTSAQSLGTSTNCFASSAAVAGLVEPPAPSTSTSISSKHQQSAVQTNRTAQSLGTSTNLFCQDWVVGIRGRCHQHPAPATTATPAANLHARAGAAHAIQFEAAAPLERV